jgi:hypothetical protein
MALVKNSNQVMTGLFLILVALLALYLAWPLGRTTQVGLGPGFVPYLFAIAQLALGGILVVQGCRGNHELAEPWQLRPLVLVLASVAFFAMSIQRMGMVVALSGLVLIGCAANQGTTWREALALAVGSVVVSVSVFVKALGLVIPLWPAGLWS